MSIIKTALLRHPKSPTTFLSFFKHVPSPAPPPPTPGIFFIPGFQSTFFTSTKSHRLNHFCANHNPPLAYFTYDHLAHGESPAPLRDASVAVWFRDLCVMLEAHTSGPQILVGASMGAWLAMLVATQPETERMRSQGRIAGIVGIGTGYNFTERWLTREVPKPHREDNEYVYQRPSQYSETGYYEVPVSMLLNSREFLLPETGRIEMGCPVTFVHGTMDEDSKYENLVSLAERIDGKVEVVTVEGGDHRLSSEEELRVIERVVKKMVNDVSGICNPRVQEVC